MPCGFCVLFVCLLAALVAPPEARAVDGVLEINQVRAEVGRVSAADKAGFPVTISEPGSYRLTGNLRVNDEATSGIRTGAACVIRGNLASQNGGQGIFAGGRSTLITNTANGNAEQGIRAQTAVTAIRNTANRNGAQGMVMELGSTLIGNTASGNGGVGIEAITVGGGPRTLGLAHNVATDNNGGDGNPQVDGSFIQMDPNVCGQTVCP